MAQPLPVVQPPPQPPIDSRALATCKFFAIGACRNGAACPFAHPAAAPAAGSSWRHKDENKGQALQTNFAGLRIEPQTPLTAEESEFKEEASHDDWTRELAGTLARFEDGAAVSKVSCPSDFSAIRLSNLPAASSQESVAAVLLGVAVVVETENVRVISHPESGTCSADVTVEDPAFAKTACTKLGALPATGSQIEVVPIPVPTPQGSSLHRVDRRRLHCSWHRPTRIVWLNFGSESKAQKVYEKFKAGVYKVLDRDVKANAPRGRQDRGNPLAWTVMLTGVPRTAKEENIYQAIPGFNRPSCVTMGRPNYDADFDYACTSVKSMLTQFGPLEWWEVSTNGKGKRIKAQARFFEESHAREAAATLDGKLLDFSDTTKLTVQLMTTAKFKISTRIYDALSDRISSQKPTWEGQSLHFVAYPPYRGYRVLKLEGQNSTTLAQAKKALDHIVEGEVATKDGKDLWHANLERNGEEYKKLKQVEEDHGVVIVRDKRKSQLRLYGSDAPNRRATKALELLLQNVVSHSHVIELDLAGFQWACKGGFKTLVSQLGDGKATFDIVSTQKRILITGSKADHAAAMAIVTARQTGPVTKPSDTDTTCSVCWTDAEEPIRTSCNHLYCSDCFTNFCHAPASGTTTTGFRITCVGNLGHCGKTLPLPELQDLLSSATFEAILAASFTAHIRRHPTDFRYCPTADCAQIYRAATTITTPSPSSTTTSSSNNNTPPATFTCSKCLVATCTACHATHPASVTCAEHRDIVSGGYAALERVKRALGVKDCPKCKTPIEKVDGCNHMTCGGCKTHICWVCMETFGTGGLCYEHLNRRHGGIGGLVEREGGVWRWD
ncbi:hypothetical protein F5144DRAFT_601941 [Chaetomium tenue]|uniref:Uncharacterized protein n=1 Tax=Chaetomium tenue TaxID=1854479 RepID=A0ACB7PEQ8_9PEZI|nr:hypothetical protein F5144DRAFT_601941 [Chaetomium globosum]